MAGTLYTPSMPVVAFGNSDKPFNAQTSSNTSSNLLVSSHFPVYETAIFTSGIFLGILITLSMMTIFRRG